VLQTLGDKLTPEETQVSEPVFVKLLRSPEIDSQPVGPDPHDNSIRRTGRGGQNDDGSLKIIDLSGKVGYDRVLDRRWAFYQFTSVDAHLWPAPQAT
jgi:hypothetical protein